MNCPKKEQINISGSQTVSQPAFNNCHEIESKDQWLGTKPKKTNHQTQGSQIMLALNKSKFTFFVFGWQTICPGHELLIGQVRINVPCLAR